MVITTTTTGTITTTILTHIIRVATTSVAITIRTLGILKATIIITKWGIPTLRGRDIIIISNRTHERNPIKYKIKGQIIITQVTRINLKTLQVVQI